MSTTTLPKYESIVQDSLLDLIDEPELGLLTGAVERRPLTRGAWVDLRPGWLQGADALMHDLLADVPWRAERRQMYERVVDVVDQLRAAGVDQLGLLVEQIDGREGQ